MRPKPNRQRFRKLLITVVALILLGQIYAAVKTFPSLRSKWQNPNSPANATLGFGNIYAISRQGSSRTQSLLEAAALTRLKIIIPQQPKWTDDDIRSIQASENSTLDRGSALAWLGHRNALHSFLNTKEHTALIIEDDIDWDVRVRTKQIPLIAYAIRELLQSHDGGYWGSTFMWDVIWLGHCGDFFDSTKGSALRAVKAFNDTTMLNFQSLHPWTRDFLGGIGAGQNQQRLVHASLQPLCTFAYAVTRAAAQRLYHEIAVREPQRDLSHPCKAYDVRLLEACRDEGMRCITVNPEIFHHVGLKSEIASAIHSSDESLEKVQFEDQYKQMPSTNIRCSARSKRWKDLEHHLNATGVNAQNLVKELAEMSSNCLIDQA